MAQNAEAEVSSVRGEQEVIGDYDEGGFSAIQRTEFKLKMFITVIRCQVEFELGCYMSIDRKVGRSDMGLKLRESGLRPGFLSNEVTEDSWRAAKELMAAAIKH